MKNKFDILYESIIDELNSLTELESDIEKEYKSFDEFKHFCKQLDLLAKMNNDKDEDVIECSLYFISANDKNPIRFDYLNQNDIKYYKENRILFEKLNDYKKHYIVTLAGEENSPRIIWC